MTDHERAVLDAFEDYKHKLRLVDAREDDLRKLREEKEAAWNLLQTIARGPAKASTG